MTTVDERTVSPDSSVEALQAEIARLKKIVQALMDRAERGTDIQGSDFDLFHKAVVLEEQIRARTGSLEAALRENERVNQELHKSEAMYRSVIETMVEGVCFLSARGRIIGVNSAAESILGRSRAELLGSGSLASPWPAIRENGSPFPAEMNPALITLRTGAPQFGVVVGLCKPGNVITWISINSQHVGVIGGGADDQAAVVATFHDVTARKWTEAHDRLRSDILEKLARGMELPALLDALARGVEAEQPGCLASILLVDDDGRLHLGAAPSLPDEFFAPIEAVPIGEGVGACGTAAARGELFVVDDIQQHPYWHDYRDLAARTGVAACWSQPAFDNRGCVVATIAIYAREPRQPNEYDLAYLVHAANLASIAISRHRDERALRMSEAKFAALFSLTPEPMTVARLRDGLILDVSESAACYWGCTRGDLVGRTALPGDIGFWVDLEQRRRWAELIQRDGEAIGFETQIRRPDGVSATVLMYSKVVDINGEPCVISNLHDISDRLAAEEALRKSEAKFSALFSMTPDPLALTRLGDGMVLEASRSFAEFFGYSGEEVVGRTTLPEDLGLWGDAGHRHEWMERLRRDGEVTGFETLMRRKDGVVKPVLVSGKVVEVGGDPCVIAVAHDITEQKQHAEHLEQIAYHDPLTGLPNRLLLHDRLNLVIAQSRRSGSRVAVCYLDLDGFKEVNDRLGHQAGDKVLIEVAGRLLGCVRGGDTVARLGGDEFVVLLSDLADDGECRIALDRLLSAVAEPYVIGAGEYSGISASIGVTLFPSDAVDTDTLVRHADHAMYAAKQAGKNRYQMFDTRLEQRIEVHYSAVREIVESLRAGQLHLHYQPKVDCRLGRVVGAEALIRWQHPTLGLLPPAEFLPLIEDTDLALEVGDWVMRTAVAQAASWQRQGIDLPVSVNAFIRQLLQPGFAGILAALLDRFPDFGRDRLQVEIVETAVINEIDAIRQVMEECRGLGVGFSLDDFGTGYSALSHLRHLPAAEIKIDRSFVGDMIANAEDLAIVEAVIGLGRAFDRRVVAEGVQTPAHIARLLTLGCNLMQGYALAQPMPEADLLGWLGRFHPDPAWRAGVAQETRHAS
jgi:diguanylate cyclase (GGDEF)-like protein/PAS domain S-box-containing protein